MNEPEKQLPEVEAHTKPRSCTSRNIKIACYTMVLLTGLAFGGFLRFADIVADMQPPNHPKADAIAVLTGGYQRIETAIKLLEQGAGARLLISGVHPATTSSQIRHLTRSPKQLFDCCVDIGHDAIDTIGNAIEVATWVKQHHYSRVLIVTNNYHMPRSLFELRRFDQHTEYLAYPVVNTNLKSTRWFFDHAALRSIVSEYFKLAGATARSFFNPHDTSSLRSGKISLSLGN